MLNVICVQQNIVEMGDDSPGRKQDTCYITHGVHNVNRQTEMLTFYLSSLQLMQVGLSDFFFLSF